MMENTSDKLWPRFCPYPDSLLDRADEIYALEEENAFPLKDAGNVAYRKKDFNLALDFYNKSLHSFSSVHFVSHEKLYGFLLGTHPRCGKDSPVLLLSGIAEPIGNLILSYLCPIIPNVPRFLPAVICGNVSVVLRATGRNREAWHYANRCLHADVTYAKASDLRTKAAKALRGTQCSSDTEEFIEMLEMNNMQIEQMEFGLQSRAIGILGTGILDDPITFAAIEQSLVRRSLRDIKERIRKKDSSRENSLSSLTNVLLQISLVPFEPGVNQMGQYLLVQMHFINEYGFETKTIPSILALHFACADPKNGDDCELPPNGRASPRALAFVLARVPLVARKVATYGFKVVHIRAGQGLTELMGPGVTKNSAVRLRERLGSSEFANKLWAFWDEFAVDVKIRSSSSTYASEKADGFQFESPPPAYSFSRQMASLIEDSIASE